jgi:transcription elongation GreA/GreB family factor
LASASAAATETEEEQRKIESAIHRLQQILDWVVIPEIPPDQEKFGFGATVVVRHRNGEEAAYRIVGMEEADPERGSISRISPLALSLLSRSAGDKARFRSPAEDEELMIMAVRYSGREGGRSGAVRWRWSVCGYWHHSGKAAGGTRRPKEGAGDCGAESQDRAAVFGAN